jgi:iron complex outermembrane receptor protein
MNPYSAQERWHSDSCDSIYRCAFLIKNIRTIFSSQYIAAFLITLVFSSHALAISNQVFQFTIPAQTADESLTKLGEISGTSIVFNYEMVKRYSSNSINGSYSTAEALHQLLEGTPLTYEIDNNYVLILERSAQKITSDKAISSAGKNSISPIYTESIDEILVTGYVGIKRSLNQKRLANSIIDGVSSEDLGKFPDQNVVESLQRITGVSIDRSDGEGQFITVRGFGPEFNNVLYNGRSLATENQGRAFSFDILAAEAISGAEIYKTPTAKLESGGIGSTIDLAIAKPMDQKGLRNVFRIERTYESLSKQFSPHYFGLISYSNETIGALLSLNYQNRHYEVDSAITQGWFQADLDYVPDKNGSGNFAEAMIPRNLDYRIDKGDRERAGGNFVLEFQVTPELKLTLDALHSQFNVESHATSIANWTQDGSKAFQSVTLDTHNTLTRYEYNTDIDMPVDYVDSSRNRPTITQQIGANIEWQLSPAINIALDISGSNAKNTNSGNNDFVAVGIPNANPIYTLHADHQYPNVTYSRLGKISDLRSHVIWFEGSNLADSVNQTKLDITIDTSMDFLTSIDAGVRFSQREKSHTSAKTPNSLGTAFAGYKDDVPDSLFHMLNNSDFLNGDSQLAWYEFDPFALTNSLWAKQNNNSPSDSKFGRSSPIDEPFNAWTVTESLQEEYVVANFAGNINDLVWSGNIGGRYANTFIDTQGNQQNISNIESSPTDPTALILSLSDPEPISVTHTYQNFLPSGNIKFILPKAQIIELSASKTITRPTFNNLAPTINSYNGRTGASQAWGGNSYLLPYESTNFDIAWSWYYGKTHFIGANFFYKSFDNFISSEVRHEQLFNALEGDFLVTRPNNTISAAVQGIEFAFLHSFDNGLGIKTNYTWVRDSNPSTLKNQHTNFSLEGLSDSYNIIGFYEASKLQAQISYNYRMSFLQSAVGLQSQPAMVEAYGQMDLSASYNITPKISVVLEGINITRQKRRSFSVYRERLLEYTDAGTRYTLGLRGSF